MDNRVGQKRFAACTCDAGVSIEGMKHYEENVFVAHLVPVYCMNEAWKALRLGSPNHYLSSGRRKEARFPGSIGSMTETHPEGSITRYSTGVCEKKAVPHTGLNHN